MALQISNKFCRTFLVGNDPEWGDRKIRIFVIHGSSQASAECSSRIPEIARRVMFKIAIFHRMLRIFLKFGRERFQHLHSICKGHVLTPLTFSLNVPSNFPSDFSVIPRSRPRRAPGRPPRRPARSGGRGGGGGAAAAWARPGGGGLGPRCGTHRGGGPCHY